MPDPDQRRHFKRLHDRDDRVEARYAHVYTRDNATNAQSVTGTPALMDQMTQDGFERRDVADEANDVATITSLGRYKVSICGTVEVSATAEVTMTLSVDGVDDDTVKAMSFPEGSAGRDSFCGFGIIEVDDLGSAEAVDVGINIASDPSVTVLMLDSDILVERLDLE